MAARWKGCILLLVAVLHLWVGLALYDYRPEGLAPRLLPRASTQDEAVLMVLSFSVPRRPAKILTATPEPRRTRKSAESSVQSTAMLDGGELQDQSSSAPAETSLDLHLPQTVGVDPPRADFLEHKPVLQFQRTRYDRAWVGQGNMTHVLARRSKIAGVLLSVVGALIVPCTEADRSQYRRGCVSDQYEHRPEVDME